MHLTVVTNRNLCQNWKDFFSRIEDLAYCMKAGDKILVREPDLPLKEYTELLEECHEICADSPVKLIAYGRPEAAMQVGVRQIHMSILDLLEKEIPKELIPTASVFNMKDVEHAVRLGVRGLTVGPLYRSHSFPEYEILGLPLLKQVVAATDIPVYGIGGITLERAPEVLAAGAYGLCITTEFMTCDDIMKNVRAFKKLK